MLNNVKVSIFPLLIFATFVMGAIGTYGSEAETITRQYSYTSNDENDKGNNPEEKIAENGKEYELQDIIYEVIDKKAIEEETKKKITLTKKTDNEEYEPRKEIVKDDVTYQLIDTQRNEETVSEKKGRLVTGYLDFDNKNEALSTPTSKSFSANGVTAVCKKTGMKKLKASSWQKSYIDFAFTSSNKNYYEWNGNEIDGNSDNPLKGYESEILKSIGVDEENYKVGDSYWKGTAHRKNGMYTRKLRVEIKKKIPHYRVNYEGYSKSEVKKEYSYISTYEATVKQETGEYEYTIQQTAVYKELIKTDKPTIKKIVYRVGIILLAITISGILFIIYLKPKRRSKVDKFHKIK